MDLEIRPATEADVPLILTFIRELADYERLSHEVVATDEALRDSLFGQRRFAEVLLGYGDGSPAAFAHFFHTFSTFLGKPGIYLEDLYVKPEFRGQGSVGPCSSTSPNSRESGAAEGWSGRSWTGTSRPSASTGASAPPRWADGLSTA